MSDDFEHVPVPIVRLWAQQEGDVTTTTKATTDECGQAREMLSDLYRLIEALDRRAPQLARSGEAQIAHDAQDLRERAMSLIRRIEGDAPME